MKKKIILFLFIALILNGIWEFLHYKLYNDLSSITGTPHLLIASLTDALWLFLIYLSISFINRNLNWINKPVKKDYFLFILEALILAILIEIINLELGRWSYKETMPAIFGIGLSPMLQLAVTGTLALWIIKQKS
ncbi:MAG: hypothetical protein AABX07_04255 [Nanoarchaeota archaeon]